MITMPKMKPGRRHECKQHKEAINKSARPFYACDITYIYTSMYHYTDYKHELILSFSLFKHVYIHICYIEHVILV